MKKVLLLIIVCVLTTTLTAKKYVVIFVDGNVEFTLNGKQKKAKKDMQISDNWIVHMEEKSTLIIMGERKHEIGYSKNIKGKKLKDLISNPLEFHIFDYPKHLWGKLVDAIFHSSPEVKDKKVIRCNGNIVRDADGGLEILDAYQLEYVRMIEKALADE